MDNNSNFDNKLLSNKLKIYFENNTKLTLKTKEKLFIITKFDILYEIDIYDDKLLPLLTSNDYSIIDKMIVKDLCNKDIIDLIHGENHFIARTHSNEFYCWGNNYWGQLGNGREDNDSKVYNKPELNRILSDLKIVDLKSGALFSIALSEDGEVYAWGWNDNGEIGIESEEDSQQTPIEVNNFDGEKVVMISCGYQHSLALTKTGRVYSWGDYTDGQLGIDGIKDLTTPRLIQLRDIFIKKISSGQSHNLLLSDDNVIYAFGDNRYGQIGNGSKDIQRKPTKLNHHESFIDIACHWSENISMALSMHNTYYVWGECKEDNILTPIETKFESFNAIFNYYFGYDLTVRKAYIEFSDLFFRDGYFDKRYEQMDKLGEGSYGVVYKAIDKNDSNELYAIKKMRFKKKFERGLMKELHNFTVVNKLLSKYVVYHTFVWLENSLNEFNLYFGMEICDKSLEDVIDEMDKDSKMKIEENLTPIGYYIASQLFIEILECIQHLHKHNIIHRDLKPDNIMLKWDRNNRRFIKICDFGLIAIHEFAEQLHSADKGQVRFAAPEVLVGNKYDTKADIFSLGIIFQQLFDIDFEGDNSPEHSILNEKYRNAFMLYKRMTEFIPDLRPNSEEILEEKHLWSLSENDFPIDNEMSLILDSAKESENFFIHSMLESYLIEKNNEISEEKEKNIFESLIRYKHRPLFVQKSLHYLYDYSITHWEKRSDLINLIVDLMRNYSDIIEIQLAATAFLHKLTQIKEKIDDYGEKIDELGEKIDKNLIGKIIDVTLIAMQLFPDNQKLKKNALLTLSSERILQFDSLDKYKCMQLVMESLLAFKNTDMNRIAVEICSILSAKISTEEKSILGKNHNFMETLLDIVESRVCFSSDYDIILEHTLSTLTNMSDQSQETCEMFIEKGGIDLYLIILRKIGYNNNIIIEILDLFSNIIDYSNLNSNLMKSEFITILNELTQFSDIDVSHKATGILAKLFTYNRNQLSNMSKDFTNILYELVNIILNWGNPGVDFSPCKVVQPIFPLLDCFEFPVIQLYAIWTIYQFCSRKSEHNCEVFLESNEYRIIKSIHEKARVDKNDPLLFLCEKTIDAIEKKLLEGRLIISSECGENYFHNVDGLSLWSKKKQTLNSKPLENDENSVADIDTNSCSDSSENSYSDSQNFCSELPHISQELECLGDREFYIQNVTKIIESLVLYKHRPTLVEKTLIYLYELTLTYCEPNTDLIDLIVILMRKHSKHVSIQLGSTACLHNLTRKKLDKIIDAQILEKIIDTTLTAMKSFPNHKQLIANASLLLCNYRILKFIPNDRYKNFFESLFIMMERYPKLIYIQINSTLCLLRLTENNSQEIDPELLEKAVELTLKAMENFPDEEHLQTNAILILCNDYILQNITFDRNKCLHLVIDSLAVFDDIEMIYKIIFIASLLVNKSILGLKSIHINKLLEVIKTQIISPTEDNIILIFTLIILCNSTDHSPETCEIILENEGINLFLSVLKKFATETDVESLILGLLNNIVGILHLRKNLMNSKLIFALRNSMHSQHIEISFRAARIVAFLCCDGIKCRTDVNIDFQSISSDLEEVVTNWKNPEIELEFGGSFLPLMPLINCFESSAVQLYAIWTINHLFSKNPEFYSELLMKEIGAHNIKLVYDKSKSDKNESIGSLCEKILEVIEKNIRNQKLS